MYGVNVTNPGSFAHGELFWLVGWWSGEFESCRFNIAVGTNIPRCPRSLAISLDTDQATAALVLDLKLRGSVDSDGWHGIACVKLQKPRRSESFRPKFRNPRRDSN
jgi:hypothetical protein